MQQGGIWGWKEDILGRIPGYKGLGVVKKGGKCFIDLESLK